MSKPADISSENVASATPAGAVAPSEAPGHVIQQPEGDASQPVLFFDGVCGLCNRFVDFLLARDRHHVFLFAPLQGDTAKQRLDASDIESLTSVVLLDECGVHRRSTAIVRSLRRLGAAWKFVAVLLWLIPRPLRDLGYKVVAGSRYRVFGKRETCRLPSAEERRRFLP